MNKKRLIGISLIVIILLVLSFSFVSADITSNVWLSWSMDNADISGSTISDSSSNGYDGTIAGTPTTGVSAYLNEGIDFNGGTTDYIYNSNILTHNYFTACGIYKGDGTDSSRQKIFTQQNAWAIQEGTSAKQFQISLQTSDGWKGDQTILTNYDPTHYYLLCIKWDGSYLYGYVDGVLKYKQSHTGTMVTTGSYIGTSRIGSIEPPHGLIDDYIVYDRVLSDDSCSVGSSCGGDIGELYTAMITNKEQYPFDSSSPPFKVTAKDFWSGSSITSFSVTIDGTTYSTTNGTVVTDLFHNDTNTYSMSVSASDYFTETYSSVDVSADYEAVLHQSEISFSSEELITNNTLTGCNYTIDGVKKTTDPFYLSAANNYVVLAECSGHYAKNYTFNVSALDSKTITVPGIYNLLLNISVNKVRDGSLINGWSGSINQSSNNYVVSFSTSGNYTIVPLIQNLDYSLILDPVSGYATNYGMNQTISNSELNSSVANVSFSLYENNSIQFYFKNADTKAYITSMVNATLSNTAHTFTINTSTGKYFLDNIPGGTYTLTATTDGFNDVSVFVTVVNNEYQSLNVYFGGDVVPKTFIVVDNSGNPVSGVVVTFTKEEGGVSVTYGQQITDFSGAIQMYLNENTLYTLSAVKTGYQTFTGDVTPFKPSYTINIQEKGTERFVSSFDDITYYQNLSYTTNNSYAEAYFNIISPSGYLQYYGSNLTYRGVTYSDYVNNSPSGGSSLLNITNVNLSEESSVTINYYFKSVNQSSVTSWNVTYLLGDHLGTNNLMSWDFKNMPPLTRAFIGMFILILLIGIGILFSRRLFVGVVLALAGLGFNLSTGLWPVVYSIMALVVLIILIISDVATGDNR